MMMDTFGPEALAWLTRTLHGLVVEVGDDGCVRRAAPLGGETARSWCAVLPGRPLRELMGEETAALSLASLTGTAPPGVPPPAVFPGPAAGSWFESAPMGRLPDGGLLLWKDVSRCQEVEARYRELVDLAHCVILRLNARGEITFLNDFAESFFGYARKELLGRHVVGTIVPVQDSRGRDMVSLIARVLADPASHPHHENENRLKCGRLVHMAWINKPVAGPAGPDGLICVGSDVTAQRLAEEELRQRLFQDALTGLPNRELVMNRLGHSLERMRRRQGFQFAVLMVDLDRFKVVNESLGHAAGDELLRRAGERLLDCVRKVDTVARLGGDEYLLLLEDIDDDREAIRVAERILASFSRPFRLGRQDVFTSASIGIVYSSEKYDLPHPMIRDADTAMYKAKAGGKARYRVFHSRMHRQALELLEMETDLRKALDQGQFALHYQPILDILDGRMVGMEALLRWVHPQKGNIPPAQFIPLAEETGLILPLGEWVLGQACREIRTHGLDTLADLPLTLAVNLSPRQLAQDGLAERIRDILADTGFDPRQVKLEITESALMDNPDQALDILSGLKHSGLRLALDDFGTGFSSLSTLNRYPFDTLKIDRSFVGRIGSNGDRNSRTIQTIIALARDLGMAVIAEGIEERLQLDRLREFNCRFGQGFLLGRPRPIEGLAPLDLVA